jgi:hypothetical protein
MNEDKIPDSPTPAGSLIGALDTASLSASLPSLDQFHCHGGLTLLSSIGIFMGNVMGDMPDTHSTASDHHDMNDADDNETKEEFMQRLIHWLQQMMFVSGETAEPSAETTWMIEEIVREQVVEMVSIANDALVTADR